MEGGPRANHLKERRGAVSVVTGLVIPTSEMLHRTIFNFSGGAPSKSLFLATVKKTLRRPVEDTPLSDTAWTLSTPKGESVEYEILANVVHVFLTSGRHKGLRVVVFDALESLGGVLAE